MESSDSSIDTVPSSSMPDLSIERRALIIVTLESADDLKAVSLNNGTTKRYLRSFEPVGTPASMSKDIPTRPLLEVLKREFKHSADLLEDAWRSPLLDEHRMVISQSSKDSEEFRVACGEAQKHLCCTAAQMLREQLRYVMEQDQSISFKSDEIPFILEEHTVFPRGRSQVSIPILGRDVLTTALYGELTLLRNLRPFAVKDSTTPSKTRLRLGITCTRHWKYLNHLSLELVPAHLNEESSQSALRSLQHLVWHIQTDSTSINHTLDDLTSRGLTRSAVAQADPNYAAKHAEREAAKYLNEILKSWEAHDPSRGPLTDFVEVLGSDVEVDESPASNTTPNDGPSSAPV